jgi:hypothetical protein
VKWEKVVPLQEIFLTIKKYNDMNTIVTAKIDVATPTGHRLFKKIARHKRSVTLIYPDTEVGEEKTYTHQEVWNMVEKRLSDHYGTEIKFD